MQPLPQRIGLSCLGLLLAIGLGIWAARDLPRRLTARVLADRLAAQVDLDRLEILEADRFMLTGLSLSRFRDYPFIQTLRLEELVVEGSPRAMVENRFERLIFRGVQIRLAPAAPGSPPDRPLPEVGELILEPVSIRVATDPGRDDLELSLEAVLRDIGGQAHGSARLNAPALTLEPFYDLVGAAVPARLEASARNLEAELILEHPGGTWVARADRASVAGSEGLIELSRPSMRAERTGTGTVMQLASDSATATRDERVLTADQPSAEATLTAASGGILEVELIPHLTWLRDGHLKVDWDPEDQTFRRLEARFDGLDLNHLRPDWGLEATADVELRGGGDSLDYRVEIVPTGLVLTEARKLQAIGGSTIQVTGSLPLEPMLGGPLDVRLEIPSGQGRWDTLTLPPTTFPLVASFKGRWQGGDKLLFSGNSRLETAAIGHLVADGDIAIHGGEASADLTWDWAEIDLESLIDRLRQIGLPVPDITLSGTGDATGSLRGPIAAGGPKLRGQVDLRQLEASGKLAGQAFHLSGGQATALWRWSGGHAGIEMPRMKASGRLTAPGIESLPLTLQASGRFDTDLTQGRLEANIKGPSTLDSGLSDLGSAHLTGQWHRSSGTPEASGHISLEAFDLAHWQRIAKPLTEANALADYQLAGVFGAELETTLSGGAWHLAGPAHLESAGFTSPDGSRVTEGLDSRWDVAMRGAPGAPIEAEATGRLGGFLLLWHTFFGDFSGIEASLAARLRLPPTEAGSRPWHLELEGALPDGPIAELAVDSTEGGWRYRMHLDDHDLAATHQHYLAPLLEEYIGRLDLSGSVAARVRGSYHPAGEQPSGDVPASWSLIGDLQARDLNLASGGGQAAVQGLHLDLPLDLRRRPVAELDVSGPRLSGRLAFDRLAVRGLELPPTESDLAVEADSVGLEKPIGLSILGGSVTFERLTLRELLRPGRHLESGVELAGIRLEKISDELGLIPLEGALGGHLAGVRLSPSLLSVDGGGDIEVFGGTVKVRDISGADVLSRFPKLKLSADFDGLDLGALTRRIDFGEMTGTLRGTVENLELFRGVPVRFSAQFETVHHKGSSRTVDVKAINNITILGTGQRTSIFDRGIQRFFDRYTYERLGVTMRLDKDVLLLRGLEHRGAKELFLRGRLPFRIDVVNAQPGKTVSFQTMVGRLRSLDFNRATTEP